MKFARMLSVIAVVLLATSIVRADDTRINNNGGGSPGDPDCGSLVRFAQDNGFLQFACNATETTGPITTFSFEVADNNTTGGGLTCVSNLTQIGWSGPDGPVHNLNGIDVCTFTAPTNEDFATFNQESDDNECELEDFVLGIPVNCGIHINNFLNGTDGDFSPLVGGAAVGLAVNGNSLPSLPEPGTLALLLIGLTGLPLLRRKFAR